MPGMGFGFGAMPVLFGIVMIAIAAALAGNIAQPQ